MTTITPADFDEFMKTRLTASNAFVVGDVDPLDRISTHTSPATLFGPRGDVVEGADRVNTTNASSSAMFAPGATNTFEVLHQSSSDDLAYWAGIQRSVVHLIGEPNPVPMDLRVTEIFRREGGQWVLIHRHADPLAPSTD